jgi:hypothetical protein
MFIYIRLLLAHLIGDFPLQLNPVFNLKQKSLLGGIPHALIIVICSLLLMWPYLNHPATWHFAFFIGSVHLLQDWIKLRCTVPRLSFWTYIADQLSHAGVLALIFFTDLPVFALPTDSGNPLLQLYCNDHVIVYCIALILATYNGFYMIRNFKDSFFLKPEQHTAFEKWYGIVERALIVTCFYLAGSTLYLLPAMLLIRPLLILWPKNPLKLAATFASLTEISLSWLIGLLCGYILFLFQAGYPIN